eukprot:1656790-Prymnesium_polylepis.1
MGWQAICMKSWQAYRRIHTSMAATGAHVCSTETSCGNKAPRECDATSYALSVLERHPNSSFPHFHICMSTPASHRDQAEWQAICEQRRVAK